jgi:hypothetical protein
MSLLKFYGTLPLIPLAVTLGMAPYRMWKAWRAPKQVEWKPNETMMNFALLCLAKPEEFPHRICPKSIRSFVPYLHQGVIGVETKQEADAAFETVVETISLAAGVCVAGIPIAKYFSACLSTQGFGICAKEGAADLVSYAGLPLIAGCYLAYRIAKGFFISPIVAVLIQDPYQATRMNLLDTEYKKILVSLNEILALPPEDPKFVHTAPLAKQFLRLSPHIENEIHQSLGLDRQQAKALLMPLQTACRHILVKHAYSANAPKE